MDAVALFGVTASESHFHITRLLVRESSRPFCRTLPTSGLRSSDLCMTKSDEKTVPREFRVIVCVRAENIIVECI